MGAYREISVTQAQEVGFLRHTVLSQAQKTAHRRAAEKLESDLEELRNADRIFIPANFDWRPYSGIKPMQLDHLKSLQHLHVMIAYIFDVCLGDRYQT